MLKPWSMAELEAALDSISELGLDAGMPVGQALDASLGLLPDEEHEIPARAHERFAPLGASLGTERAASQVGVAIGLALGRLTDE
jgi:hypothetical protein